MELCPFQLSSIELCPFSTKFNRTLLLFTKFNRTLPHFTTLNRVLPLPIKFKRCRFIRFFTILILASYNNPYLMKICIQCSYKYVLYIFAERLWEQWHNWKKWCQEMSRHLILVLMGDCYILDVVVWVSKDNIIISQILKTEAIKWELWMYSLFLVEKISCQIKT